MKLDELLNLPGTVAVGEFERDGTLVNFRVTDALQQTADTSVRMASIVAQYCAAMSMLFTTLAWSISGSSQMDWLPQRGWTYSGGDWTIFVSGRHAVIVETAKADLARLWRVTAMQ